MGFTSRPVLQLKKKNASGQFALTFVVAVLRYGGKVSESDRGLAYERADVTFKGQMQQNFIVLSKKGSELGINYHKWVVRLVDRPRSRRTKGKDGGVSQSKKQANGVVEEKGKDLLE